MYDLKDSLERLFQADIIFMMTTASPNVVPAQFQLGTLYTHMMKPTVLVRMNMRFKMMEMPRRLQDTLNIFDGVSTHARVTSITHELNIESPTPVHTVEFIVFDLEEFTKDMQKIVWDEFSEKFHEQLESVLEKEEVT